MNLPKIVPLFLVVLLFVQCNENNSSKNLLLSKEGWRLEIIEFPLEFAPSLLYFGAEYIRFAPGWGNENTDEYFSYVFLWKIDQDPKLSSKKLEAELETYFNGLMNSVSEKKLKPAKAFFEKINDSLYAGKILTYDAFTAKKELALNIIVDYRFCNALRKHLVVFNISPQPMEHSIWKKMKKVTINAKCD